MEVPYTSRERDVFLFLFELCKTGEPFNEATYRRIPHLPPDNTILRWNDQRQREKKESKDTQDEEVTQIVEGEHVLLELMQGGRWCDELQIKLQSLVDANLLRGICYRQKPHLRICFLATSNNTASNGLCLSLLHMLFPIFLAHCLTDQAGEFLPKPLLDGPKIRAMLEHAKIEAVVKECNRCHRRCGKFVGAVHDRLAVECSDPKEIAAWLFAAIGCFEIEEADRVQESGEPLVNHSCLIFCPTISEVGVTEPDSI